MIVPFGPWEPDSAGVDTGRLTLARNVYPLNGAYGPMLGLGTIQSDVFPERCVGLTKARLSDGGWVVFAGSPTKLYKLVGTTWEDYSRVSGGVYNVPQDEYWSFAQYGSQLIATNVTDDVQVINVDTGATNFSALGGSPPKARYVAVVGEFVVLAALASNLRKVRNSAIGNSTGWTVGVDLCDEQEFADGGRVTGAAGGEFGYILQEKAIRRMMLQPGMDYAFRFERIEQEHGCAAGYSLVATANGIFFISDDGFYAYSGAGLIPIGASRINKWFRDNSDTTRFFATIAFVDPFAPRVYWAFYNSDSSTDFDRLLIYDWKLDRWSYAEVQAQYWATFATAGTTLEQLDVYGSIDDIGIPFPFDSRVWEGGRPVIAAINGNSGLSFLESTTPLTATLRTCPQHLMQGGRAFVTDLEPMGIFNGATLAGRVGKQESTSNAVAWSNTTAPSSLSGMIRLRASGRVHQFELELAQSTGTLWSHAQGLNVMARPDGVI